MRIQIVQFVSHENPNQNSFDRLPSCTAKPLGQFQKVTEIDVNDPSYEEVVIFAAQKFTVMNFWKSTDDPRIVEEQNSWYQLTLGNESLKDAKATFAFLLEVQPHLCKTVSHRRNL